MAKLKNTIMLSMGVAHKFRRVIAVACTIKNTKLNQKPKVTYFVNLMSCLLFIFYFDPFKN